MPTIKITLRYINKSHKKLDETRYYIDKNCTLLYETLFELNVFLII
jgi:hypothetical protein